ncbi:MAG: hypothetical protein M3P01_08805 [Actinomycetota bacterium]|nr:hypothetical protein [Actinomycetota bacterium]
MSGLQPNQVRLCHYSNQLAIPIDDGQSIDFVDDKKISRIFEGSVDWNSHWRRSH